MRSIGIDVGTETIKVVEIVGNGSESSWSRRALIEHEKQPDAALLSLLRDWQWESVDTATVTGRTSRIFDLPRVPTKQALARGFRQLFDDEPATVVSIGGHGFAVLELRGPGIEVYRENARCSQGTGNFLRQLVERFDLSIDEASRICEGVEDPSALSGRCPVILKTDMTHLANKGEDRRRIVAGLYDAVTENVKNLLKPRVSPPRVLLTGGVSRSHRVRENFRRYLSAQEMHLVEAAGDDALFLDALGAAMLALEQPMRVPPLSRLVKAGQATRFEQLSALGSYLNRVTRLTAPPRSDVNDASAVILGFDIGSTGSKLVALDVASKGIAWEGYLRTNGDPLGAARNLLERFASSEARHRPAIAMGVTGSGREIVGSLLSTCYGSERVYVLNEIAAHAEGALHYDDRVDTIFEIGGQDAKYIRLAEGRIVDAAMNEACSAGTGSFIEEQGRKFSGVSDVIALGKRALEAEGGVSLGQHCSVFMAEVIDDAVSAGVSSDHVIAGIYDSIVQNYLNRVKGCRSVGQVVFCQGMPFAADALAAAVARQTQSQVIVPPNPGTVGALGIALLARKHLASLPADGVDAQRFLEAAVTRRDDFICQSHKGCGGSGNLCRIDRIQTLVKDKKQTFTWGGGCSLWDKGTGKKKLPDLTPDPFREREALIAGIVERVTQSRGNTTIALSDEFQLKELFPFFATFLYELGCDLVYDKGRGGKTLKRGAEQANVPYCAPMQLYHGIAASLAETGADAVFVPMLRQMPRAGEEHTAISCPIVQASPDILGLDLGEGAPRILSPVIDFGDGNLDSTALLKTCQALAASVGSFGMSWWRAYQTARDVQTRFWEDCIAIGRRALSFARDNDLVAVIVLGRPYTIYNPVLNSNVPALVREQGALPIPIDCYPVADAAPTFRGLYWGHGQRNLRAVHQVRRTPGQYAIWCSNYSCGPDSMNLHFFSYAMSGKPYAVVETDGHSGDAGTKTRVEAFLHCVREDRASDSPAARPAALASVCGRDHTLAEIRRRGERVLFPRMGDGAETVAACLRGTGVPAEVLPIADHDSLRLGRRYTSGKECVPMAITLGSLLTRLDRAKPEERFAFFMPTADGPCRFGTYNILHRIVLERLGYAERVKIWSPEDSDYFAGLPSGFAALVVTGFAAYDALQGALFDVRPVERTPGAAQRIFDRYQDELLALLERAGGSDLSMPAALLQVANGRMFGCGPLLERAAREFRGVKTHKRVPTVAIVGEIYVRLDPFANDFVIDRLEQRGIRSRFAPFSEWLEYTDHVSRSKGVRNYFGAAMSTLVQRRIQDRSYELMARSLGWGPRTTVHDSIEAANGYVRPELTGEAILTVGGPVHEWREGAIDGVVSVGPHECMPNKIAEAQFFHVAEREGLASLTLNLNGEPIDPELLDSFAFEVKRRFEARYGVSLREEALSAAAAPAE
ncbi:MAG: acyl-CoA dehydratase activase-related protein [Polyangiaceae bacterium]